jgi:hypothetical protein
MCIRNYSITSAEKGEEPFRSETEVGCGQLAERTSETSGEILLGG